MKRIITILFAAISVLSVHAQEAKLEISRTECTVREFLDIVTSQTSITAAYSNESIDDGVMVSAEAHGEAVLSVAKRVLSPVGLDVKFSGGRLLIFKASTTPAPDTKRTIKGTVIDSEGNPIPGAGVLVAGTLDGTVTDMDGKFTISVDKNESLIVTCLGYKDMTVKADRDNLQIVFQDDLEQLEEIVVVGYGFQKKANLTGSVTSISSAEVAKRPVMNVSTALQGLASGVTVTQSSGQPGSDSGSIRIRGIGTLNDSNPLILVDGVAGSINGINPSDIESISVLKDAASAAIYGSRAANGVIMVTTKSGNNEKFSATYDGYVGTQSATALPEFVDSYTYMTEINKAYENVGKSPLYSKSYLDKYLKYKDIDPDHYPDTDWQKELITGSGLTQNHSISLSGGTNKLKAFSSFAYADQYGIFENFKADRFNFRSNLTYKINDFIKASLLIDGRRATVTRPTHQSIVTSYINRVPGIYTAILSDGRYGTGYNQRNPIALCREGGDTTTQTDRLRATFGVDLSPIKNLNVSLKFTPNINYAMKKAVKKGVAVYEPDQESPAAVIPAVNTYSETWNKTTQWTLQTVATYNFKAGKNHEFTIMGGYEQIDYTTRSIDASRDNYSLPEYEVLDAGSESNMKNGGTSKSWALISAFARFNWSYAGRYLFEANFRTDGSSRFAQGHRFGYFPSFSAAWRISQESFMKDIDWLSNLKIRASWGMLGNQEIGTYPAYSTIEFGNSFLFGDAIVADGAIQKTFANDRISWESTTTTDFGIDMGFFKGKLTATVDVYNRLTTDILLTLPVPSITGLDAPYQNAGVVQNLGWDIEIGHQNNIGGFSYGIAFNLSDVYNKVIDLKGAGPIKSGYTIIEEGYPINSIYGFKADGIYRSSDEVASGPDQSYFKTYGAGDIRYVDLNDDYTITPADKTIIGNQIPRLCFGLNLNAQWKGIDMSLMLQGIGKRDIILTGDCVWALYNAGKMQTWMLDNWTVDNPNASYPRLIAASDHNNFNYSSFWVYNAAFARLKNVQIGYTIPKKLTSKIKVDRLRVYVSGDNIFNISSLPKGWDPEMGSGDADIYPLSRTIIGGLQITL